MKRDEGYKGFRFLLNEVQMRAKMYFAIFAGFLLGHILLFVACSWYFFGDLYRATAQYVLASFGRFRFPELSILEKIGRLVLPRTVTIALLTCGIYLFYPFVIRYFGRRARRQSEPKYVRGARLIHHRDFKKRIGRGDLPFGAFRLPRDEEIKHVFCIGRPGTGKTVLLSQIVERLRERNEKAVIYDFKGDYVSKFFGAKRDLIINPLDVRCIGWSVFNEIKTILDVNSVSQSLIPPVYSGESFWSEAARAVFAGILHYCWQSNLRSNRDIWNGVTAPGKSIHDWLENTTGGERGLRFIEDASSKQALSVFSTMMQYTSAFEFMARNDGAFSITEWLSDRTPGFIFVVNRSDVKDTLKPILSLFIDLLGKKLLAMPDDLTRRIFFILDEFGTLQRLSSIKDLLIASRSKGGACLLGIQDMGQLNKIYTEQAANTVVNACGTSVMFSVADPETADYLSRKIGDTEFEVTEESYSAGIKDGRDGVSWAKRNKTERLLLTSQLMNLPDLHAYVKIPNIPEITETTLTYKSYPAKTEPFLIRSDLILEQVTEEVSFFGDGGSEIKRDETPDQAVPEG